MTLSTSEDVSGLVRQEAARIQSIQALHRMRREARDEISRLIRFLDESDEYVMTELEDDISADLEDGGDNEPSLGFLDSALNQERIAQGALADHRELDKADDEPSLGSIEDSHSQIAWATGTRDDREDDAGDSPEHDPAESGIADEDGLREQLGRQAF